MLILICSFDLGFMQVSDKLLILLISLVLLSLLNYFMES